VTGPRYDHVLLDLDGAVYVGRSAVPGAAEAIAAMRAAGIRVAFVTNDPVSARADYVRRLEALGVQAVTDDLVTAAWAAAQLVAEEHPGARVLTVGSAAYAEEHRLAGLEVVSDPAAADVVSLGGDVEFSYAAMRDAVRAVLRGAPLYGSNRDRTFPLEDGPAPAAGAAIAAVEYAADTTARCAGKPERAMFDEARRLLGDGRYLMVGDRLDADVAGGAGAGMDTALVLTGSATRDDVERWQGAKPTYVLGSVAELPGITCSGT
jgi:glycerol 3-phosphatase-2